MFRKRLTLALIVLAAAALLQGGLAWWAIESASVQVLRGRVASDLLKGHHELATTKQRLRNWTSQVLLRADVGMAERDDHLDDMRKNLDALQALAHRAAALDSDNPSAQTQLKQRLNALAILRDSVQELEQTLRDVRPMPADADPADTWRAIKSVFDTSKGQDLRFLVAQTLASEQAATEHERKAADLALYWLAGGVVLATLAIALFAAGLALFFAKTLQQPFRNLSEGAHALQRGDLQHRMTEHGYDEFAAIARTLNTMAGELQAHRAREDQTRHELEQQVQARTAELEQALRSLQDIDTSRRQLFADISHELRTPTTAIRGEAEIALRGQVKPIAYYQEALQRIAETAMQLGRVIDDLLTMARSENQALSIQPTAVKVAKPVQEALQQVKPLQHDKSLHMNWVQDTPEDLVLCCDAQRLRQLLVLLLDNAMRYSHAGARVTLHTQCEAQVWRVDVTDHGIGIPAHELPHVFDRHFRGESARKHRADGVGLGLALARMLAHAHGGSLDIQSLVGQGTTVTLRIPLQTEAQT